ncbi:MAG: hypothetical protein GXY86_16140 [Firmicutes bacterium]|nr:hypothetical protein [Bacillota bacterium]
MKKNKFQARKKLYNRRKQNSKSTSTRTNLNQYSPAKKTYETFGLYNPEYSKFKGEEDKLYGWTTSEQAEKNAHKYISDHILKSHYPLSGFGDVWRQSQYK